MTARILPLAAILFLCAGAHAQNVNIGVLGIFHPAELTLSSQGKQQLIVSGMGARFFVGQESNCPSLRIRASQNELIAKCGTAELRAPQIRSTGRNQEMADFVLAIPGKMRRAYRGTLRIVAKDGVLVPIVQMDLETAVSSVVRAEMSEDAPPEALKAQAVVTRSYFVAGGARHADFDFCDLTHCQFLREPPPQGSPASRAASETRGMILEYNGKPVASMFTRSCAGHTRTPKEIGLPAGAYPYFPVLCDFCYRNPAKWTRNVSRQDAATLSGGENARLSVVRRIGWSAVPSNNFEAHEGPDGTVKLEGTGQGHGIGLCQRGSRAMAENGAGFNEILRHYFPNTAIVERLEKVRGN